MSPVDSNCPNCDGRGCMGCIFREHPHDCEDDCPVCCPEVGEARRAEWEAWVQEQGAWRERALAAEALVRAKDEAIGELLGVLDGSEARANLLSGYIKRHGLTRVGTRVMDL